MIQYKKQLGAVKPELDPKMRKEFVNQLRALQSAVSKRKTGFGRISKLLSISKLVTKYINNDLLRAKALPNPTT